jgi:hypothetical protein
MQWNRDNAGAAQANTIIIYAWNESDEGGWLVPTLSQGPARLDAIQNACVTSADPPTSKPLEVAPTGRIVATLGKREVILESGRYGLKYFPDECLAFVQTTPPIRVLMAAGVSTTLLEGRDMKSLMPHGQVLKSGKPGSFDNGYAGISGVARDPGTGDLLAFYHAEDHEGMPPIPGGIPGFYCSVGLAVSTDNGTSFRKMGPVITGSLPKDLKGRADQGCGDLCVVADSDHRYLYVYYTDHSRIDNRGVQICMARCPIKDAGKADLWRKYHNGAFEEPGLGGKDTPVLSAQAMGADAIFPQVTFVEKLHRYVMVFNITVYREFSQETKPEQSGIYIASSQDGIRWSKPSQLLAIRSIATIGREVGWHPTLLISSARDRYADGWLYYSYSQNWGHKAPQKPHYLVGQPLTFSIVEEPR